MSPQNFLDIPTITNGGVVVLLMFLAVVTLFALTNKENS